MSDYNHNKISYYSKYLKKYFLGVKVAKKFKFNRVFGLKLHQRLDETFFSILILVILFFSSLIFINSQIDYSQYRKESEAIIRYKYKTFITQLIMDEIKKVEPEIKNIKSIVITEPIEIEATTRPSSIVDLTAQQAATKRRLQRQKVAQKVSRAPVLRGILKAPASAGSNSEGLPEVDDYFNDIPIIERDEILDEMAKLKMAHIPSSKSQVVNNFDPGDIDDPPDNLFNYVVRRQGTAYLDVPNQLTKEAPSEAGYRDPEEVERVVHQYSPMIEYCFRKHTKFFNSSRGYIKVAFKISYEGYVIPESVRIINSTFRNRSLEQCIKNYIRHWRNFKPLDESMGIAQVVQKFVFN